MGQGTRCNQGMSSSLSLKFPRVFMVSFLSNCYVLNPLNISREWSFWDTPARHWHIFCFLFHHILLYRRRSQWHDLCPWKAQREMWKSQEKQKEHQLISIKILSKQNITKDTETENRLTVTRGERGGDYRGKGWRVCRNNYEKWAGTERTHGQ